MASIEQHQSQPCKLALDHGVPASACSKSYGLTFSRSWLVQIAKEQVKIANEGYYFNRNGVKVDVKEALQNSLNNSVHYHSSHIFQPEETSQPIFDETEFHVCYGSSLNVARKLSEVLKQSDYIKDSSTTANIGILNSASGKRPEKFLRGTLSQEEGICRASLLYPCLIQYVNRPHHFYQVNHKPKYLDSSSSCAIFSPGVPVIREDSMKGTLLDDYYTYSFVSIPAPNAFALAEDVVPKAQTQNSHSETYEHMSIQAAMKDRIFRALSIFAENGCTDLVLCAFGCGVHGNDPEEIAMCFHDLLANEFSGRFRTVCFAIHPSRQLNYKYFEQVFGENKR